MRSEKQLRRKRENANLRSALSRQIRHGGRKTIVNMMMNVLGQAFAQEHSSSYLKWFFDRFAGFAGQRRFESSGLFFPLPLPRLHAPEITAVAWQIWQTGRKTTLNMMMNVLGQAFAQEHPSSYLRCFVARFARFAGRRRFESSGFFIAVVAARC